MADVKAYGAAGDGIADDSGAIQRALDEGGAVTIPAGNYRVCRTLRIPSRTAVTAEAGARIFSCEKTPKHRGDFLLTNADPVGGNRDISVTGGIWDGNFGGENDKPGNLFDPDGWSGACLNFVNVEGLALSHLRVVNTVTYHVRMAKLQHFVIRDIGFASERLAYNQDGLHFGGEVYDGEVSDVRAETSGQTNDDLIALNADDSVTRIENLDLPRGAIERVRFTRLFAEDCHTAVRMLSIDAPIRDITITDLTAGCRCYALNLDAARYCRTPLFQAAERPGGVGIIERVRLDGFRCHATRPLTGTGLLLVESNVREFAITGFARDMAWDASPSTPTLAVRNVRGVSVTTAGRRYVLASPAESLLLPACGDTIRIG